MRDLICLLEVCHLEDDETITMRQLILARESPVELARNYINRWLDKAHRCEGPFPRNIWIALCLHSMHQNLRIFAIGEDFENFNEMSRFMSNVEETTFCILQEA